MNCLKCGSSNLERPAVASALEIWICKDCSGGLAVHCHYLPDLSGIPGHELFIGTAFIGSSAEALKALIKLKKVLTFAERFEPFKLEEQQKAGKLTCDLCLLDLEVQKPTHEPAGEGQVASGRCASCRADRAAVPRAG